MKPLDFISISDLSKLIKNKEVSPKEILDNSLKKIEKLDPILNSFAFLDIKGAKILAEQSEKRMMNGTLLSELDGIPTSIKDLIAQKDLPQRFGSRTTSDNLIIADAPSVERLRNAGAVLLGKSTTSEFGCKAVGDSPLTGITRNPWNTELTPGGSSCGAASMVAAGIVPYAIGTDGGGSIRIPASLTGLFGIKAQFGRVPVYPTSATPTLAHVGPLTRNVLDACKVLQIISGKDFRDPFTVTENVPIYENFIKEKKIYKIAWSPNLGYAKNDTNIEEILKKAIKNISSLGHEIDVVDKVFDADPVNLWNAEFYAGVGTRLKSTIETSPNLIDPAVLEVLKIAISQKMNDYYNLVFQRYAFREKMRVFFEKYDLLITPTLPCVAFEAGLNVPKNMPEKNIVSWVYYTYPFNLTGQPAASINAGFTPENLPVGMQVIGRSNREIDVLNLCHYFENNFLDLKYHPEL
ncbi:MAG: amidase [Pelagibacteraceae bacterium]|nr:amidase [Pelagibacteraceae bacterium]